MTVAPARKPPDAATCDRAAKKIAQGTLDILFGHGFFAPLVCKLRIVEDPTCATAWTDGVSMGYFPGFVDALSTLHVVGVLAHEVLHCALGHPWRRGARCAKCWNQVCDYAINVILLAAGFQLPAGVLRCPSGWEDKTEEWMYAHTDCPHQGQPPPPPDDPNGDPDPGPESWHGGDLRDAPPTAAQDGATEEEWKVATLQAAQMAHARGQLPAGLRRMVAQLRKPKDNPWDVMERFVQMSAAADYSWAMPNVRTVGAGLYLPSLRSAAMGPVVAGLDTSGSIDNAMLAEFVAHLQVILDAHRPEVLHVVCCDSRMGRTWEFYPGDVIEIEPDGGGGTNFCPVFEWVEAQGITPCCLVYLTDGDGDFPDRAPDYPVLWALTERNRKVPWGDTVHVHH